MDTGDYYEATQRAATRLLSGFQKKKRKRCFFFLLLEVRFCSGCIS
jgi:hypothetical protein